MYVCVCNQITDKQLRQAVAGGAHTLGALQAALGVGDNCGGCLSFAASELNETLNTLLKANPDQFYAA